MIPTLFSVSYAGLWGQHQLDIESFIKKAADLGYAAVELMAKRPHLSILDTDAEKIASIKRCARDNNIKIVTIAGYTDFTAGRKSAEVPFFKGLREGGFEGPVAYEMCSPLRGGGSEDNLDKTAEISLNQIRALINPPAAP